MKTILLCLIALALPAATFAMTTEDQITLTYLHDHPDEFTVKVAKGKEGLIDFTIVHNVPRPMYHVAHLAIYHAGKLTATSDTPSFGKKRDNTFHFSAAPEDLADTQFSLSDSALDTTGEVPVPGTVIHEFHLLDFVPRELLNK
jgi:hypothetical protein